MSKTPLQNAPSLIDFTELVSGVPGEGLEQLARLLAQNKGMNCVWTGRGADGGKDLIITEIQEGPISSSKISWLVSCKDKAKSGDSVAEKDLPSSGIKDKLSQHKADGFLLVTTTTVSTAAKALLDGIDKSNGGTISTLVWDAAQLTAFLLEPGNRDLVKQFLPESYKRLEGLTTLEGAVLRFREQLPVGVLQEIMSMVKPYSHNSLKGSMVWPYDTDSASAIDEIVKQLIIERNKYRAVEATEYIEYDAFVALLDRLYAGYERECFDYLSEVIVKHSESDIVYNAYQFLSDHYDLEKRDIIKLAPFCDDASELIDLPEASEHIREVLLNREGDFKIYQDLDERFGNIEISDARISEISFMIERAGRVEFRGDGELTADVIFDKEMLFSQDIAFNFTGYFDEFDVVLESVLEAV